jgi:hypothetical protein
MDKIKVEEVYNKIIALPPIITDSNRNDVIDAIKKVSEVYKI